MSNLPSPAKSWIRPRKLLKISGDQNGEVEYFIAKAQITVNTGVIDDSYKQWSWFWSQKINT